MIVEKIAVKKTLAVTLALALGLSLPGGAWAQAISGRVAPISAGSEAGASYVGAVAISADLALPTMALSPSISAMAVGAAPSLAPAALAASAAVLAAPAAIDAHPVIGLLDRIQKAGVSLDNLGTGMRADAAKIEQAARSLPEGSSSREQLMQLADSILAAHAGTSNGGAGDGVRAGAQVFDGMRSGADVAAPAPASGFKAILARAAAARVEQAARALPEGSSSREQLGQLANSLRGAVGVQKGAPAPQPADPMKYELNVNQVRYAPVAEKLPEGTNVILSQEQKVVGQDDALKAIRFALEMKPDRYNLYVAGDEGSGRAMAIRQILSDVAPKMKTPNDLVAVTNFEDKDVPVVLEFAPGRAAAFAKGIEGFVEAMKENLPIALNSGAVGKKKQMVMAQVQAGQAKSQAAFDAMIASIKLAGKFGVYFKAEQAEKGVQINLMVTHDGKPMTQEEADAKIAAGAFTADELKQATAELQEKKAGIFEAFKAMVTSNMEIMQKVSGIVQKFEHDAVVDLVNEHAAELARIATAGPATPEDEAFAKRAGEREAEINEELQKFAAQKFGRFGVALRVGAGENGPVVAAVPAFGKQPLDDALAAQLIEGGKIAQEEYAQAKAQIAQKTAAFQQKIVELMELTKKEHAALQASKPKAGPESEKAKAYVQALLNYAASHYKIFMGIKEGAEGIKPMPGSRPIDPEDFFRVSVLTENAEAKGAPVVWEENPTYERLFGVADGNMRNMVIPGVGVIKTDGPGGPSFKTGSYMDANGGFLVLRALDVLRNPGVWPALMKAVRTGEAEIAEGGFMGMASGKGEIHHLPAKVKIVLIGSPMIQMLLAQHDEDFATNFQGVAQFQPTIMITEEAVNGFLNFMYHAVAGSAGQILPLTREAIGRVLERAARLADSNKYFTSQFGALHGLLQEAAYAAQKAGRTVVLGEDVDAAQRAKTDREDVHYKRMSELYQKNVFRIDTTGSAVGQINGLAVMGSHGVQMRITFVAGPGKPGLVSVDNQAGTTGKSFNKALGNEYSFLMNEFGQTKALKAHIRVSYEQNYGGIDGDSSTSTTLYGILSALSGVPIHQRFAVTGSADQFGNVQAIGGVNEKIEGFFDLCLHRGLTGDQGVIIPRTNVADLQLSPAVSQAIKDGKFHIYAVDTVAQGMEILTGVAYQTIKEKAAARLDEIAKAK